MELELTHARKAKDDRGRSRGLTTIWSLVGRDGGHRTVVNRARQSSIGDS
jgi:hypothetical protein